MTEHRYLPNLSRYAITAEGEVLSAKLRGHPPLRGGIDHDGYVRLVLMADDGTRPTFKRSILVCRAFHGERPAGMEVRHKNGIPSDDRAANLRWSTHRDNIADKQIHGTQSRGQRNGLARLTEANIRFIRANAGHRSDRSIAEELGVHRNTVRMVRKGETWSWLK